MGFLISILLFFNELLPPLLYKKSRKVKKNSFCHLAKVSHQLHLPLSPLDAYTLLPSLDLGVGARVS